MQLQKVLRHVEVTCPLQNDLHNRKGCNIIGAIGLDALHEEPWHCIMVLKCFAAWPRFVLLRLALKLGQSPEVLLFM